MTVRVVIVDDHRVVRDGLCYLLSQNQTSMLLATAGRRSTSSRPPARMWCCSVSTCPAWTGTACAWRASPIDFPPCSLVVHYFTRWTADGTLDRIHATLREQVNARVHA